MEFPPCATTTLPETSDDTNIGPMENEGQNVEKVPEQRLMEVELPFHNEIRKDQATDDEKIFQEQEAEMEELMENLEENPSLVYPLKNENGADNPLGIIMCSNASDVDANFVHGFAEVEADGHSDLLWGGVEESLNYVEQEVYPNPEKKRVKREISLVVWNKDRKKWLQGGQERRNRFTNTPQPDDYTFFRIKVPTAQDLKEKEKGAKSSRCPPDTISNCSKTIKKGRRVTSLKHIDYKKFLQCYIHVQELKNFKVDTLFNKKDPEPSSSNNFSSSTTTIRRRRANKIGPRQSKMAAATFVECSSSGFEQLDTGGNYHTLTSATATLELVHEFDTQIMSIDPSNPEDAFTVDLGGIDDVANFEQVDLVDSFHVSSSPPRRNEFGTVEITFDETGKPRCTYTDLIERALSENGGLTVSEIYQWISDHYPFFKPDDDRWKNSVRHNLSINPYFKKGEKARSGAGHLWTISEESRALRPALRNKDFDIEDLSMCIENDTDRAVANILGQYHLAKNNMEGKVQQPMDSSTTEPTQPTTNVNTGDPGDGGLDSLCTPPFQEEIHQLQKSLEVDNAEDKLMEISPVVIEYETNGFPGLVDHGAEFTIDLSQFQFPDATGISFDGDCTFYTL